MLLADALKCRDLCARFNMQGWDSGESARLPPLWPRFDSWTRRHMWAELNVGSRLYYKIPNSNSIGK